MYFLQIKLQAKVRCVRIEQTKEVQIWAPYNSNTINDHHELKHQNKMDISARIIGDSQINDLYAGINWEALKTLVGDE